MFARVPLGCGEATRNDAAVRHPRAGAESGTRIASPRPSVCPEFQRGAGHGTHYHHPKRGPDWCAMSRPSHDGRRTAGGPRGRATASRHRPAAHITAPRPKSGTPQETRATAPLVRPVKLAFTIVTASRGRPLAERFRLDSKT